MAKTIKMCDMTGEIAAKIFELLNPGKVKVKFVYNLGCTMVIETDTEPKDLIYPEGWYYTKGYFTNKHNSTTGAYVTVLMFNSKGDIWDATYCTAD